MPLYHAIPIPRLPLALALLILLGGPVITHGQPTQGPTPQIQKEKEVPKIPWKTVAQDMFVDHGEVTIKKNEIQLGEGTPATGVRYQGAVPRNEFEIECEARRTGGSDFFYGLTFPIDRDYCSLIVGGWGGTAVGLSNVDGLSAIENSTTQYIEFEKNRWYQIRLRVAGGKIGVWIDNKQIIDIATKGRTFNIWWEQTPLRPLGIASWNTSAAIRRFKIIDLKGPRARDEQHRDKITK